MSDADSVGYIVSERPDGYYIYACDEHAPDDIKSQPHREVLRAEAAEEGATCNECGLELAEVGFAR